MVLADERQTTRAWAQGADGEERLGARLDSMAGEDLAVLHDRRIPGTRANIDHLAVTAAGVYVIDAKRYKGKQPGMRVEGGLLRPRVEKLVIAGRDRSSLIDGALKQVATVGGVVGDIPVTGILCFIDADWSLIGGAFQSRTTSRGYRPC